ncbi:MAG: hypothetical protein KC589_03540 [Nanoarchaeota archaeon]|nr:hypothetical protein [Nanoarchaeota archaeon]
MEENLAQNFYSRNDIQKAILKFAKNREIGTRFDGYFGKRPEVMDNLYDIKKLIEKGVLSFHMSEEIWENPLLLGNQNQTEEEKIKNRNGWDLILDLDGVDFLYAQIAGKIIIEFLEELGIKNISTKFSGNKGFHIAIPFEAFSKNIIGIGETRTLFPQAARKIASYIMFEVKGKISKQILENEKSIENIAKKYNIPLEDLINDDPKSLNFNFEKVIEIDTILIASRHLFRMPYSLNEKSGLVSIPVENNKITSFKKFEANPDMVKPEKYEKYEFLKYNPKFGKDADILLVKSYEDNEERKQELEKRARKLKQERQGMKKGLIFEGDYSGDLFEITEEVDPKDFPQTIQFVLNNELPDGKKRALFLILTYLYSIKYKPEHIDEIIENWNKKQPTPLKTNYLHAQLFWFNSRNSIISPPNFTNDNYYKGIGIPEDIIQADRNKFKNTNIKNPLHYTYIMQQRNQIQKEAEENQKKDKKKYNKNNNNKVENNNNKTKNENNN